jgi:cation transport ATPase
LGQQVNTVIFDKTGTLTLGKPVVSQSKVLPIPSTFLPSPFVPSVVDANNTKKALPHPKSNPPPISTPVHIWSLIAAMESASSHPLAKSAAAYALDMLSPSPSSGSVTVGQLSGPWKIDTSSITETPGMGISAPLDIEKSTKRNGNDTQVNSNESQNQDISYKAVIGSRRWVIDQHGCLEPLDVSLDVEAWQSRGHTCIYVGLQSTLTKDGGTSKGFLLAVLAISDLPRPTSRPTVAYLQKMGVRVVMMTGDHLKTALAGMSVYFNF